MNDGSMMENTVQFSSADLQQQANRRKEILLAVYQALEDKDYNPINQIVGYLLSGDPAYIPRHNNARNLIRQLERDELLEELVRHYLLSHQSSKQAQRD